MEQKPRILDISWKYALPAAVAGAVVSMLILGAVYTASSPLLFNAQYQSKKVIDTYQSIQPLPLLSTDLPLFAAGYLVVAMVRNLAFTWLYSKIPGTRIMKGVSWGLIVWLTLGMFTEYYTAINLLGEPAYLAAFEYSLLLPVFVGEAVVVATIYSRAWK